MDIVWTEAIILLRSGEASQWGLNLFCHLSLMSLSLTLSLGLHVTLLEGIVTNHHFKMLLF